MRGSRKARLYAALAEMGIVWPLEFTILIVSLIFGVGASAATATSDPTIGNPIVFGIEFTLVIAAILAISDAIVLLFLYLFSTRRTL